MTLITPDIFQNMAMNKIVPQPIWFKKSQDAKKSSQSHKELVGIKLMKLLPRNAYYYPPLSSCDSSCKKTWAEDRIDLWYVAFFRSCNNVLIRSNNTSRSIASNNFISSGSKYNQSCSCEIVEEGGRHTCAASQILFLCN